jgi:hypothetical protein
MFMPYSMASMFFDKKEPQDTAVIRIGFLRSRLRILHSTQRTAIISPSARGNAVYHHDTA